jgi:hypothetical protein
LLGSLTNGENDAFQILDHIVVGETEHAISARSKPSIAAIVVANALFEIVTLTVDPNDKFTGMRHEVGDIIAHWALSAKSQSGETICLQVTPQQGLGASHRAS